MLHRKRAIGNGRPFLWKNLILSVVLQYSAWVEQAKASKGVSYNAFPKFVAPKCDEDLLEDPAVRDELLARRGYAKEIFSTYSSSFTAYSLSFS